MLSSQHTPYSPSLLRALVSSEYSNKHHHHHQPSIHHHAPQRQILQGIVTSLPDESRTKWLSYWQRHRHVFVEYVVLGIPSWNACFEYVEKPTAGAPTPDAVKDALVAIEKAAAAGASVPIPLSSSVRACVPMLSSSTSPPPTAPAPALAPLPSPSGFGPASGEGCCCGSLLRPYAHAGLMMMRLRPEEAAEETGGMDSSLSALHVLHWLRMRLC